MAKADISADSTAEGMYMSLEALNAGEDGKFLECGWVKNPSWTWTKPGVKLFISATAGGITETPPSGAGDHVKVLRYTISATEIKFSPSPDTMEITQ